MGATIQPEGKGAAWVNAEQSTHCWRTKITCMPSLLIGPHLCLLFEGIFTCVITSPFFFQMINEELG